MRKSMQTLLSCTLITVMLMCTHAAAKVKAVTGQLTIIVMVDGEPAFQAVVWRLKPQSGLNYKTISRKHIDTVDLEPGKYEISVSIGNETHTRNVHIKESSKQQLIMRINRR